MNIDEIIKKIDGFSLICTNYNKHYSFCSTIDYAQCLKKDYIYIPLIENNDNIFEQITLHLQNSNCKGFIINKVVVDDPKLQEGYHRVMKEFSSKIEVVILVRNTFNSALKISEYNIKKYKAQTICIAGSEEKSILVNMLSCILSSKGNVLYSLDTSGPWQKLLEPLLVLNENTKYCILDIDASKENVSKTAAKILKDITIIFSKTSANYTARYKGVQGYIDEVVSLSDDCKNIKNIFTYEENDLLNANIRQCSNLNIVEESKIITQEQTVRFFNIPCLKITYNDISLKTRNFAYYIPRCAVITALCAKSLGLDEKTIRFALAKFIDVCAMYIENKLGANSYSVLCTKEHTHFSIKSAIKNFCEKYKNNNKILILSRITGLDEHFQALHKDIIKLVAKCNFKTVVLIDMEDFGAYYKKFDKQTFIKKLSSKNNKLNEKELINLGLFLKGQIDSDTAILVCTKESLNLGFLF